MRGPRSIATRLTLLFAAVALVTLGSMGLFLYFELAREMDGRHKEELQGKLDILKHLVSEVRDADDVQNLRRLLDDMIIGHGGLRMWLGTSTGTAIYGGEQLPLSDTNDDEVQLIAREDGVAMRAMRAKVSEGEYLPVLDLVVAIDPRASERTLAEFRLAVSALVLAGGLLAALLGAWAARRGLAPVHDLAREASAIAPVNLSRRLNVAAMPAELQELGASFNGVLERLQESYQQMEAFNADVAHELRSPLTNLIGGTELALSRERDAASYRDTLAGNLEELERLKVMVNDMLFLARADRGDRVTERSSADLRVEAGKVLDYFEAALEEAGITAAIEGEGVVAGDPSLLRRALTNLLGNAIRYTSRGQRIAIRLVRSADAVQLSVRNPGDTVDPVHLPRIFDRFFRVDAARRAVGENHGLGLAIVRAIARMHGGDVFATSAKGITEIGLRVPAQAGESPRIASQVGAQRARTTET